MIHGFRLLYTYSRRFFSSKLSTVHRYNPFNIRLLPHAVRKALIADGEEPKLPQLDSTRIEKEACQEVLLTDFAKKHLKQHNVPVKTLEDNDDETSLSEEPGVYNFLRPRVPADSLLDSMQFPPLFGKGDESSSMDIHFKTILNSFYKNLVTRCKMLAKIRLPPMPSKSDWLLQPGWTRYFLDTNGVLCSNSVEYPVEGEDLFFDVEVAIQNPSNNGRGPSLAVAASSKAWYVWISKDMVCNQLEALVGGPPDANGKTQAFTGDLIPLGKGPRIVAGHNIAFDRIRILEEYHLEKSQAFFLDTLSLHSCVGGLSTQQRAAWTSWKKQRDALDCPGDAKTSESCFADSALCHEKWAIHSSNNSLKGCLELYCSIKLDKSARDLFVHGSLSEVRNRLAEGIDYCANDVYHTHLLLHALWPLFIQKCPESMTLVGQLLLGKTFLTTDRRWLRYIDKCEDELVKSKEMINSQLIQIVDQTIAKFQPFKAYEDDQWLRHLDWTVIPEAYTKGTIRKIRPKVPLDDYTSSHYLAKLRSLPLHVQEVLKSDEYYKLFPRPLSNPKLFGKPRWYKDLWDEASECIILTPNMHIVPYLLRLEWNGCPVHFIKGHGWCYFVGGNTNDFDRSSTFILEGDLLYRKIPQLDSAATSQNVGSLFAKAFVPKISSEVLTSQSFRPFLLFLLEAFRKTSLWNSFRSRITSQLFVQGPDRIGFTRCAHSQNPEDSFNPAIDSAGVILPQLIPMGTVSRRAIEPLWLTATQPKKGIVGSELKSNIVAPQGYKIVGADVDSQELWIASLYGDALFGHHGATGISWMNLLGEKASGTDVHTKTAAILGVSRDQAKIFNYGRIYGAGVRFAANLLKSFCPQLSHCHAETKARDLYHKTKGQKESLPIASMPYLKDRLGRVNDDSHLVISKGGTESFMFNELELIAASNDPRTALSRSSISNSLLAQNVGSLFMNSRINWIVQSSAVDYLHILLISIDFLTALYDIPARLMITIHDEIRYLVKEEYQYHMAFILQVANCWVRLYFSQRLGLKDLPLSVAFFSAVDIDFVLRKEVTHDCVSPTNPEPMPRGESLNIYQLLEKLNSLGEVKRPEMLASCQATVETIEKLVAHQMKKAANCKLNFKDRVAWIKCQENFH